jgi:hypothetical protein
MTTGTPRRRAQRPSHVQPRPAAGTRKRRRGAKRARTLRVLGWVFGILLTPFVLLYVTLLFMPIPLPFVRDQARNAVMASLPPSASLELGDMALALEGGTWPVLQFTPVVYKDAKSGAKVQMKALDVGFSPIRVLIGQPGATITMVGPHLQVNQDLLGPRLANFKIENDPKSDRAIVRVQEGEDRFPSVGISAGGVSVHGVMPDGEQAPGLRSDNDWLIYNLEATEQSLGDIVTQAQAGRFSRLTIRDGIMDMNDAVYGVFRRFTGVSLEVSPGVDGTQTVGKFSADFGGQTMQGDVTRKVNPDGTVQLSSNITNIDFASFMPFVNDPDSMMGLVGTGAVSIDVNFDGSSGKVTDGVFHIDMTGMDLRINEDRFPIATSIQEIKWDPAKAQFNLSDAELKIGQSSATISGIFVLGLDEQYGPTVGMSIKAKDVDLHPNDLGEPAKNFDEMSFSGWSAPLYGALGIDQMEAVKGSAKVTTKGRVDMLRKGLGFDLHVSGSGVSADDLKRLWPYMLSRSSRDWFVKNVKDGMVESADMQFSFPVGTVAMKGEDKPIPQNGISIDMVGTGVKLGIVDSMAPVAIDGKTRLQVRDGKVTVAADGANVPTSDGTIALDTPAVVIDSTSPGTVFEVSGEIKSGIPALVALAKQQQPQAVANPQLPLDLNALAGDADVSLVSTITLDKTGALKNLDYAVNGSVQNFASTAPVQGHQITDGQLSFTASQKGYQGAGQAKVDGMPADLKVDGVPGGQPNLLLSSTVDAKDLKAVGFDASNFLSGQIRFVAKPMPDNSVQMAVDIKDAALTIKDLGISKPKGVPGTLDAAFRQNGSISELSQIDLNFGDVQLQGSLEYDDKKGLQSAEFSNFALSPGDKAQLSLTPMRDGYALRLRGDQLDLKPMLQRFFGLGGGTGGPQASQFSQTTLALDMDLKRALGFYKTAAYNMQLSLVIKGTDIQKASMQAQFGDNRSVSVTTNPTPDGKVLSVAFNDLGSLLRFGGVYPRIEGGDGSFVMSTKAAQQLDVGSFDLHSFAVVDEANAAQILESHQGSRDLIARQNKITFKNGHVDFTRKGDRIEITNGLLTGDSVGGTMHGFIYTNPRQYDLVGTYVPLFGLNSVFQKLPLFGPILGGRNGEGLIGVTFAIRGSLDKPTFQINPASLLVPGAFRGLFEFRARGTPGDNAPIRSPSPTIQ